MTHWWRRIGNRVAADNYHACYYDMVPPTRGPPAGSGLPTGPGGQGPRRLEAEEGLRCGHGLRSSAQRSPIPPHLTVHLPEANEACNHM